MNMPATYEQYMRNSWSDTQALDRWTLIPPCLPRWYVFSGLVTMYGLYFWVLGPHE